MSIKEGDLVTFPFAGTIHEGVFLGAHVVDVGVNSRKVYRCKAVDGTIYPVDLSLIKKL